MNDDVLNELLVTDEVARLLRVSPGTLRYWRTLGEGPPYLRVGARKVVYRRTEVEHWLVDRDRPRSLPRRTPA